MFIHYQYQSMSPIPSMSPMSLTSLVSYHPCPPAVNDCPIDLSARHWGWIYENITNRLKLPEIESWKKPRKPPYVFFVCFVCFVLFALFIDLLADQVQLLSRYMPEAFLFCNPFQPREKKRKRTPKVI